MSARRWWFRLVLCVVAAVTTVVVTTRLEMDPDPLRVVLITAAVVVLVGLLADAGPGPAPSWRLDESHLVDHHRRDARTAANLRILHHHLAMDRVDSALRDRLGQLTEQVLLVRHGERPETARAYRLMGPELTHVVNDPPHRLSREDIERCITRIEEL